MSDYRIFPAMPEHLAQICAIEAKAATRFPPEYDPEHLGDPTMDHDAFLEALADKRFWVISEKNNPEILGFAYAMRFDSILYLAEMDVLPEHSAKGLGSALLSHVVSHGREEALGAVYLTTFAAIPWNAPFYAKRGFSIVEDGDLPDCILSIIQKEREIFFQDRVAMRMLLVSASKGVKETTE